MTEMTEKIASDPNESRDDYIARVESEGFVIVFPKPDQLQIDIDNDTHHQAFTRSWEIFVRDNPEAQYVERASKSGLPRRHITVTLPFSVGPWQRIALQAALGSDPVREILSCMRCLGGMDRVTLFCEKKGWNK